MKILVTGGAGYLGSILCEHLLKEDHSIVVLDNLKYGQNGPLHLAAHPHFEFVYGDVRDASLLQGLLKTADAVIPLAAIVGAPACDLDPWGAQAINLEAIQLLNRLRSSSQWVVYPTTNSGYGTKSGAVFCTEETPLEPISLYGATKVEAEKLLLDSPNTITLRLATVFGVSPRMRWDLLVNYFVKTALQEKYLVVFEKNFKRNFIHIRDVADCFVHCLTHFQKMMGRCYNVGLESANLSKEELVLSLKKIIPDFYVHFSDSGSDPDKRNYIISNQRLKEAGFEAKRSLEEGFIELIRGYQMLGKGMFSNV